MVSGLLLAAVPSSAVAENLNIARRYLAQKMRNYAVESRNNTVRGQWVNVAAGFWENWPARPSGAVAGNNDQKSYYRKHRTANQRSRGEVVGPGDGRRKTQRARRWSTTPVSDDTPRGRALFKSVSRGCHRVPASEL